MVAPLARRLHLVQVGRPVNPSAILFSAARTEDELSLDYAVTRVIASGSLSTPGRSRSIPPCRVCYSLDRLDRLEKLKDPEFRNGGLRGRPECI